MSRISHRFATPFVLLSALAVGCADNQTAGPKFQGTTLDPTIGNLSSCSVAQDSVDAMLPQLFTPGSDRGKSVSTYNQMQKSLRQNKDAAALGYMQQIIDLAFTDFYANPSKITGGRTAHTAALVMDLVQGLYCLNTGTLLADFPVPLQGVATVVVPGTPTTVALTDAGGKKRAASQFDASDLPPATEAAPFYIVSITPITTSFPAKGGPLNTQLAQYGPFYEFHVEPSVPFANEVLTGVCINSTADAVLNARLRLAHDNETGPLALGTVRFGKIEIINEEAGLDLSPLGLDCTGLPVVPASFLQRAASWFLPAPLSAGTSPATTGGKVRTYSPFGAVDPGTLGYGAAGWSYGIFSSQAAALTAITANSLTLTGGAPFWSANASCPLNAAASGGTTWAAADSTFLVAQRTFSVPATAADLTTYISVDNDARVFVDGVEITGSAARLVGSPLAFGTTPPGDATYSAGEFIIHENCPATSEYSVRSGPSAAGTVHVITVIARDRGVSTYFDASSTP
jgi:hypothetical protein